MNIGKIVKAAGCSAVCTLILCGQSAFAVTEYPPEGGQWNYGVGILGSYSDYLNQQRAHGSTVNHNGNKYSAGAPAGQWSQALASGIFSGCAFYYNL